jgi:CheY-like chemotaxis protein
LTKEPCKVLVVDADRDNADTAVILLQMWGHESEAAYSHDDALSKARTLDPDVILVDLGRPIANGFDLAAELRKCCPEAKLVALSTFTAGDIVRRTRATAERSRRHGVCGNAAAIKQRLLGVSQSGRFGHAAARNGSAHSCVSFCCSRSSTSAAASTSTRRL